MIDVLWADADRFPPSASDLDRIRSAGLGFAPVNGHSPAEFSDAGPAARGIVAWGGPYDARVFDALPHLRVLARCGAGFDNIDLVAAAARGIITTYVPGGADDEVAEHTIALLLAMFRKVAASDRAVRSGGWPSSSDLAPMRRVRGSRLGLVGFGRIAQAVAWRARGLGIEVSAFDPYQSPEVMATAQVTAAAGLDELLAGSDVVSLHTPGRAGDPPLIGAPELARMRPGALLINTARGSLVETSALVEVLTSGHLGGAALDVLDPEPIPAGHPLIELDNVVITPHSAAFSVPALTTIRDRALDNLLAVLSGAAPITPIPMKD